MHLAAKLTCAALLGAALLPGQAAVPLWPDLAPPQGVPQRTVKQRGNAQASNRWVTNVHTPTLTPYLPQGPGRTTAIVVCPGGGYSGLALDKEGHDVARWLQSIGIAGLVLEYRLPRPKGHVYGHEVPSADARRALALARERAAEWRIDPERVGIMGFSAGGHLASTVGTQLGQPNERPTFLALIYPVISLQDEFGHRGSRRQLLGENAAPELIRQYSTDLQVGPETPATFLVSTDDDGVKPENAVAFYLALRRHPADAELHIYRRGGHGYGLRDIGAAVSTWHARFRDWLDDHGWLTRS